jgi:hypothetical protein
MNKYYRIIELDNKNNFKTLFHTIDNKSRILPLNKWIKAIKRFGSEGANGKRYKTGFHVLKSLDDMFKYSKRFKIKNSRRIISLYAKNLRTKKHSRSNVLLAEEIYIPKDCEIYNLI